MSSYGKVTMVMKNAWVDTDWEEEMTKTQQWWILPREWVWLLVIPSS